jgi:spermidine synthase
MPVTHAVAPLLAALLLASCGNRPTATPAPLRGDDDPAEATPRADRRGLPRPPALEPGMRADVESEFSHIRIYDRLGRRYLMFVRDNGQEVVESALDIDDPDRLALRYTQLMFAGHLLQPEPERVLLIGLGGGSMVRFMRRFMPEIRITALDIDPAIVALAEEYWAVAPGENLDVLTEDGFRYIGRGGEPFDTVYLDAFLKPSMATDEEGAPLAMQTVDFYRQLRDRLTEGGVLVININVTPGTDEDLATLRTVFPQLYLFEAGNLIVVASPSEERVSRARLRDVARGLDRGGDYGFTFAGFLDLLEDEPALLEAAE